MKLKLEDRNRIKEIITSKIREVYSSKTMTVSKKQDNSLVTEVDLFISNLLKSELDLHKANFLSEEEQGVLKFPLYVLDPIDGTRELVEGIPECALSLAYLDQNRATGWGWIYNPFTGFDLTSDDPFTKPFKFNKQRILGLVSSSEWAKNLYPEKNYKYVSLAPRGSIAFKLGLLASGSCDFVITRKPKNIWDIAAGTILCWQRGFVLYQNGVAVEKLESLRMENDMLWCRPEQYSFIHEDLYR